jgi:hypothetical protein
MTKKQNSKLKTAYVKSKGQKYGDLLNNNDRNCSLLVSSHEIVEEVSNLHILELLWQHIDTKLYVWPYMWILHHKDIFGQNQTNWNIHHIRSGLCDFVCSHNGKCH